MVTFTSAAINFSSLNFLVQSNDVISSLSGHLSKENYEVFALSHSRPSLDDVYLQATGKTLMDVDQLGEVLLNQLSTTFHLDN